MQPKPPGSIEQRSLDAVVIDMAIRLVLLGLFVYWSFLIVAPFLVIFVWAIILAVAIYPLFAWVRKHLGGRSGLTAFLITVLGLLIVLGPTAILAASLADSFDTLLAGLKSGTLAFPPPDPGIRDWPVVGIELHDTWTLASANLSAFLHQYQEPVMSVGSSLLGSVAGIGGSVLTFAASILIAGFLYTSGPEHARRARGFARRIVSNRGEGFVDLAGATIRNISRGVIGISLLQSFLAGLGLMVAGVPAAGLIAFGVLVLGIIQIGPTILLLPVIIWAWTAMGSGAALAFTVYMLPVALLDNVLKPIVMAKGLQTPMLVIFIGVIGGTLAHGLIGLFLGPVILAVFYELLVAWVRQTPATDTEAATTEAAP